ncbi:MAG: EamA family transporter [Lentisphaeria bacterium]|nr:EamA family transporter [Lentisphaeria bacterium]
MLENIKDLAVSKPVVSLSYYSTRGIFLSSTLLLLSTAIPRQRKHFKEIWQNCRFAPFAAGVFASLTYVLVLIAMVYVTNVSYVQVFRQLGLIFGLFAGIIILKERGTLPKYLGSFLIVTGLVLSVL